MNRSDSSPPGPGIFAPLGHFSLKRRIVRDGLWVGAGQFFVVIASLLGTRLTTQFVSRGVWGQATLLLGIFAFGKSLVARPILSGTLSYYPEYAKEQRMASLRRSVLPMLSIASGAFAIFALPAGWLWCRTSGVSFWAVLIICAMMWLDATRDFETSLISMARRQRLFSWLSTLESIARPAAIVLICWRWAATPQGVILGMFLAGAIHFAFILLFTHREGAEPSQNSLDPAAISGLRRQILKFAIPLIPMAILSWVVALSDRYIIQFFGGYERVGIYAATYGLISQGVMVGQTLVGRVIQPIYYKAVTDVDVQLERSLFRVWLYATIVMAAVALLGVLLLKEWIARLLLAEPYRSGSNLMPWIAGGYAFWSISCVCEARLYAHKQTTRLLIAYAIAAAFAIAVPIALVPRMGILGAAIACPIYFAAMASVQILLFRRRDEGIAPRALAVEAPPTAATVSGDIHDASVSAGSL